MFVYERTGLLLLLVHSHSVHYSVQCFVHKQRQLVPHESVNSIIMQLLDRFCAEWRFVESENFEEYLKGEFNVMSVFAWFIKFGNFTCKLW
jgi:hypothetical protein